MVDFERVTEHVSRKTRSCVWCGEPIKCGERYARRAVKYEGELSCESYHLECSGALRRVDWLACDGKFYPGEGVRGRPFFKEEQRDATPEEWAAMLAKDDAAKAATD